MKIFGLAKDMLLYPFSRKARKRANAYLRCHRLYMTLLVKDEEDLIEQNIRFHAAMGVDGFVVTLHCSTDGSKAILEKLKRERYSIEVIEEQDPAYRQAEYVDRMIRLAKRKFKADWVINADADEFYFARQLNLKRAILEAGVGNVLLLESTFGFPDDGVDCLEDTWFVSRPLPPFEWFRLQEQNIPDDGMWKMNPKGLYRQCPKVIHRTRGYRMIDMGNHGVTMRSDQIVRCADICLYHYSIRNYKGWVRKVERYLESVKTMPQGFGEQQKHLTTLYEQGRLRKEFNARYSEAIREKLVALGVVTRDPSVLNFLQHKGIRLAKANLPDIDPTDDPTCIPLSMKDLSR